MTWEQMCVPSRRHMKWMHAARIPYPCLTSAACLLNASSSLIRYTTHAVCLLMMRFCNSLPMSRKNVLNASTPSSLIYPIHSSASLLPTAFPLSSTTPFIMLWPISMPDGKVRCNVSSKRHFCRCSRRSVHKAKTVTPSSALAFRWRVLKSETRCTSASPLLVSICKVLQSGFRNGISTCLYAISTNLSIVAFPNRTSTPPPSAHSKTTTIILLDEKAQRQGVT